MTADSPTVTSTTEANEIESLLQRIADLPHLHPRDVRRVLVNNLRDALQAHLAKQEPVSQPRVERIYDEDESTFLSQVLALQICKRLRLPPEDVKVCARSNFDVSLVIGETTIEMRWADDCGWSCVNQDEVDGACQVSRQRAAVRGRRLNRLRWLVILSGVVAWIVYLSMMTEQVSAAVNILSGALTIAWWEMACWFGRSGEEVKRLVSYEWPSRLTKSRRLPCPQTPPSWS